MPVARPDLSGLRIKSPTDTAIYLIDPEGYRRHIPNPETYENLFRDWNGIVADINANDIARGPALSSGAVLAKSPGRAEVYLVSNGIKRHIASPAVMDKYYFDGGKVQTMSQSVLDSIPTGQTWT